METLIAALIENEMAENRAGAIEIIDCMREEVEAGEDIQDVLLQYDLELDYAIDLF